MLHPPSSLWREVNAWAKRQPQEAEIWSYTKNIKCRKLLFLERPLEAGFKRETIPHVKIWGRNRHSTPTTHVWLGHGLLWCYTWLWRHIYLLLSKRFACSVSLSFIVICFNTLPLVCFCTWSAYVPALCWLNSHNASLCKDGEQCKYHRHQCVAIINTEHCLDLTYHTQVYTLCSCRCSMFTYSQVLSVIALNKRMSNTDKCQQNICNSWRCKQDC